MAKNSKDKENFSFYLDPRAIKLLDFIARRETYGNRSVLAEQAIWDLIGRKLAKTPEFQDLIYNDQIISSN